MKRVITLFAVLLMGCCTADGLVGKCLVIRL